MDVASARTPTRPDYVPTTASYIGELEHSDGTTQSIWVNISDLNNPNLSDVASRATELFKHLIGQHNLDKHEIKSADREYVTYTEDSATKSVNHNAENQTDRTWQAFERCVLGLPPTTSRRKPRREEPLQLGHDRPLTKVASETSHRDSRRSSSSSPRHLETSRFTSERSLPSSPSYLETRRLTSSPKLERMGSPKPGTLKRHLTSTFKPPRITAVPTADLLGMDRDDRETDLATSRARPRTTVQDDLSSLFPPTQRPLSSASEEERELSPELPLVPVHHEGTRRHRVTVHTGPRKAVMTEAEVARKKALLRLQAEGRRQRDTLVRGRNAVRANSPTSHEDVRIPSHKHTDLSSVTGPRKGIPLSEKTRRLLGVE